MIKVLLYGIARLKFNTKQLDIEANSVKDLLTKMALMLNVKYKDMKGFLIYVNDINITDLSMFKTKLKDGDVVMILSPSTGG